MWNEFKERRHIGQDSQGGHPIGGWPGVENELKFWLKINFDKEATCWGRHSKGFVVGKQEFKLVLPPNSCNFGWVHF